MNEEFYMSLNNTVFNCNSFGKFGVSRLKKKRLLTVNTTSLILILISHINKALYLTKHGHLQSIQCHKTREYKNSIKICFDIQCV